VWTRPRAHRCNSESGAYRANGGRKTAIWPMTPCRPFLCEEARRTTFQRPTVLLTRSMIRYWRRMVFFVPSHQSEARPPICTRIVIRYTLLPNMATSHFVFLNQDGHDLLRGNRHWLEDAIAEAGIRDFTWHIFATHLRVGLSWRALVSDTCKT
jgi:hypothetical protein